MAWTARPRIVFEGVITAAIAALAAVAVVGFLTLRPNPVAEPPAPGPEPTGLAEVVRELNPPHLEEAPLPVVAAAELTLGADRERQIYHRLLQSAVLISWDVDRKVGIGSGTLIDRKNRLILTNYHVAGDNQRLTVYFPRFQDGRPVADLAAYLRPTSSPSQALRGKSVLAVRSKDLALVQVDRLPASARALPLAKARAAAGDLVYSIGNPGDGKVIHLWSFAAGKVREVARHTVRTRGQQAGTFSLDAELVVTDSPTHRGDSGGPLVNPRGELVGVTQGAFVEGNVGSVFIDGIEVRALVRQYESRRGIRLELPVGPAIADRGTETAAPRDRRGH